MGKDDIFKNTVDATNQVKAKYIYEGEDKEKASLRVMFIGNSITLHGPKPEIGWLNNWGMAASSKDKDYVHIIERYYNEKCSRQVSYCILNGAKWEADYTSQEKLDDILEIVKDFTPDILIIRLGENFNKEYLALGKDPYLAFNNLFASVKLCCQKVVTTSLFWEHPSFNEALRKAALNNKIPCVEITDLSSDEQNEAIGQFENFGVALHPSDIGMKNIAERILNELKK